LDTDELMAPPARRRARADGEQSREAGPGPAIEAAAPLLAVRDLI